MESWRKNEAVALPGTGASLKPQNPTENSAHLSHDGIWLACVAAPCQPRCSVEHVVGSQKTGFAHWLCHKPEFGSLDR